MGVDIDPKKVAQMRDLGYDCVEGDVTNLTLPARSVRFVTMSHILEHLPNLEAVRRAVACAARVASDFLFIQGPFFDADGVLRRDGLKFYWSDWTYHTCHLTTDALRATRDELGLHDYVCMGREEIAGSTDPARATPTVSRIASRAARRAAGGTAQLATNSPNRVNAGRVWSVMLSPLVGRADVSFQFLLRERNRPLPGQLHSR